MVPTPRTVLVVENRELDARVTLQMLERARSTDFTSEWVPSVGEARNRLSRGGIDAVLLDLFLDDGQGIETVQRILDVAPSVPVVVLTSLDDETVVVQAARAGAQDYLLKNELNPGSLERSILGAIERRRIESQREIATTTRGIDGLQVINALIEGLVEEFETHLTTLLGHASMVVDELPEGSDLRSRCREIILAARNMATVLDKLRGLVH